MTAWGPEDTIQVNIMAWLDAVLPDALVYHVPNGGLRSPQTARKLKRLGVVPGVPDLVVMLPEGRTVYIEVKASKGVMSGEQVTFFSKATALGHDVIIARSVEDVRVAFQRLGIVTREARAPASEAA